ncbi:hypothetical protein LMHOCYYV_CDS0047 [Staphylococcus phage PG-2021_4]
MDNGAKVFGGCLLIIFATVVGIGVTVVLPAYIISQVLNGFNIYISTWNTSFLLIALYIIFYVVGSFFSGGRK